MAEVAVAEVLPTIHACNVYVTLLDQVIVDDVHIEEDKSVIELENKQKLTIVFPKTVECVSNSVSGLKAEGRSIVFRVQTKQKTNILSFICSDLYGELMKLSGSTDLSTAICGDPVLFKCAKCEITFISPLEFERSRPLPSLNWDHISETWFCHNPHGKDKGITKPSEIKPELGDFLYTDFSFLINTDHKQNMETLIEKNDIMCKNCGNNLGKMDLSKLLLWTHSVQLTKASGKVVHAISALGILVKLFEKQEQDSFGVNCRLVLENNMMQPKQYLYLVTMDTNMNLLLALEGKKLEPDSEEESEKKKAKVCSNFEFALEKKHAIKLLFSYKVGDDDESGEWVDDIHVNIIPCNQDFFVNVHEWLLKSSSWLPYSQRKVGTMTIGYILKS
ncbi:uncharacterized protein LOC143026274 [Oratosquilla oratoria]|uniref:uncharacterized protein LOC143026274 n=1 Tax=Oratosquilla oratoria TaxID=337810 RepID=UPI003F75A724